MISGERRAYKRSKIAFGVKYRSRQPFGIFSGSSVTRNISAGGVYFESLFELPVGCLVDCEISPPEARTELRFLARVVRCDIVNKTIAVTFGVAAEFLPNAENPDTVLRNLLSKHLSS